MWVAWRKSIYLYYKTSDWSNNKALDYNQVPLGGDLVGSAAGTGGSRRQLGKGPGVGLALVRGIIYPSWSSECFAGPPEGAGKHSWWERDRDHPAEPATTFTWLISDGWMGKCFFLCNHSPYCSCYCMSVKEKKSACSPSSKPAALG